MLNYDSLSKSFIDDLPYILDPNHDIQEDEQEQNEENSKNRRDSVYGN